MPSLCLSQVNCITYNRNMFNLQVGGVVGYQVRFKSAVSNRTRIMYCTTGILLRHLQSDNELQNFTHVILDEAHERDVNTDLLMNLLRSAIEQNPALKLIIMSATIDTGVFQNYFNNAATLSVPGFTFPVQVYVYVFLLYNFSFGIFRTLAVKIH